MKEENVIDLDNPDQVVNEVAIFWNDLSPSIKAAIRIHYDSQEIEWTEPGTEEAVGYLSIPLTGE